MGAYTCTRTRQVCLAKLPCLEACSGVVETSFVRRSYSQCRIYRYADIHSRHSHEIWILDFSFILDILSVVDCGMDLVMSVGLCLSVIISLQSRDDPAGFAKQVSW